MSQQRFHEFDGQRLVLKDQLGRVLSRFDLSKSRIPKRLAKELLRALATEFGHTSLETQRQTFRGVRKLVAMLVEEGLNETLPLPASIAMDFHNWLERSGLAGSTAQSHQNNILSILKWCGRNSDGLLSARTSFVVPAFKRQDPKERAALSEEDVKGILQACYKEIEEVATRLAVGDRLLSGDARTRDEEWLADLIGDLLVTGRGRIATQAEVTRGGNNLKRRVADAGGLKPIHDLLYVNPRSMFPFYLAIICQTGGNPTPIARMRTDCIVANPLRADLEKLNWDKKRSNAEQRDTFPRGKKWSAPSLVRRYLKLTEEMRTSLADGYHKDDLFIALPHGGSRTARVPCAQLLHVMLGDFIGKHGLKNFDFKDLRPHVAEAHRRAGGSVLVAQQKLNHRNASTTQKYLSPSKVSPEHDHYIHKYQGHLISLATATAAHGGQAQNQSEDGASYSREAAATVFGFECSDPFGGIAGHSPKGTLCTHFAKCATCPGAVVPVDDPKVIANLLAAHQALESAKTRSFKEGWVARFNSIYQPTLTILEKEILPSVSNGVRDMALDLVRVQGIPYLE